MTLRIPNPLNLLDRLRSRWRADLKSPSEEFLNAVFGAVAASGARVTQDSALGVATVFACVSLLARTISTLPLKLYEQGVKDGRPMKQEAIRHPVYDLIVHRPNMEMTPADFRGAMMANLALRGNAYARIVRDRANRPRELWPVHSSLVTVERSAAGVLQYRITDNERGGERLVPFFDMLHIRGLSFIGCLGLNMLASTREAIGLAQALDENAARFFGNSSRPGLVLTSEAPLTEAQIKALKNQLHEEYGGTENAYKTLVLGAMKAAGITAMRADNESSQFDETRARQAVEICKLFGVPPHKVGILDKATFSNIEQQQIQFVVDTIGPLCVQWEQAMAGALLEPTERARFFIKHNLNGLLRGDSQARANFYSRGILDGWLTRNEVRQLEDIDPLEGLDLPLRPLNMGDGTKAPREEAATAEDGRSKIEDGKNRLNGHKHETTKAIFA